MSSHAEKLWIGGQEHEGSGELIPVEDPSTGTIFAQYVPTLGY